MINEALTSSFYILRHIGAIESDSGAENQNKTTRFSGPGTYYEFLKDKLFDDYTVIHSDESKLICLTKDDEEVTLAHLQKNTIVLQSDENILSYIEGCKKDDTKYR